MSKTSIVREAFAISLETATRLVSAAIASEERQSIPMSVVVVDAAGQLVHASRMDGATLLSYEVAQRKAWTAAMTGFDTDGVRHFIESDAGSLRSMPHLPGFSVVSGGLPIIVDKRCVGAIGVSGGPAPIDLAVAKVALESL
ncbi:heme-binding protein [Rhizobium rhizogenes]|uniref:Heme-binding protein n=1 Tax=Rhizobium rhizogenes (strain K84 / ATCC BAA-868) TaxID=311403 RepID=B9JM17_RHIR8|nr:MULTISPECIES: heme-binding protein [Rhizobium]ACM28731.1 conserved hypothetical protein [Rhizobium rhizogenes K84]OCJ19006.1 glycolate utilization protein [Agrobacterium sp. B131/95]EJK88026.1 putative protein, possibly involved in utilization of glycolate and propanediol [Rhizobium sp. AP16]NTI24416.1 heme-binding protein [Rhizobium rhizogenes]NTI63697.1 heme-binding protein [Rhizobium rhizogenes]